MSTSNSHQKNHQSQVCYLGHIVGSEGVSTDPAKIDAVKTWAKPSTIKDVKQFLGFCFYYRKLVPGFPEIAHPFNSLTRRPNQGTATFTWTAEAEQSFQRHKEHLTKATILGVPQRTWKFHHWHMPAIFASELCCHKFRMARKGSYRTTAELSTNRRNSTVLPEMSCWL